MQTSTKMTGAVMKYIEDFKEDEKIVGHYLCKQKQTQKTKSGKNYLSLKLQDKTGMIDAKVWELNNDIHSFEEKDVIKIDGLVLLYQNSLQLKVSKIRKSTEGEYVQEDYIPTTDKNVDSLVTNIQELIDSVRDASLNQLLRKIFLEDDVMQAAIKVHSAAKTIHHAYMGGLIEHIVAVTGICDFLSTKYKFINRDLLITGALLHDIGKLYELSPFPDNDYTDEGELLGHIVIGVEMITHYAKDIEGFSEETLNLLKHLIVSHHGELEFGSPQRPKTIEAMVLHTADSADSKIKMFEEKLAKSDAKAKWVGYHNLLQRNMRRTN